MTRAYDSIKFITASCKGCRYASYFVCENYDECIGVVPFDADETSTNDPKQGLQQDLPLVLDINGVKYRRVDKE